MKAWPTNLRRHAQRGALCRGVLVLLGIVAAVVLQVAGPRLQGGLAGLFGLQGLAPAPASASALPSPRHYVKVSEVVAFAATATPTGALPAP